MNFSFKNSILTLLIISLGTSGFSQLYADDKIIASPTDGLSMTEKAALAALTISCIRLWTREGDNEPVGYDWEKIKNFQEIPSQLFHVWNDGLVGQFGKGEYPYYDKETQKLKLSKSVPPKGLGGWFTFYYKGVFAGIGTGVLLTVAYNTYSGLDAKNRNASDFIQAYGKALGAYAYKIPDWFKLGAYRIVEMFLGAKKSF